MIQGVLTPAERLHIAREIVPMIDRGMRMDPGVVHYLLRHGRCDLP